MTGTLSVFLTSVGFFGMTFLPPYKPLFLNPSWIKVRTPSNKIIWYLYHHVPPKKKSFAFFITIF